MLWIFNKKDTSNVYWLHSSVIAPDSRFVCLSVLRFLSQFIGVTPSVVSLPNNTYTRQV